ncbi:hypothetical protein CSW62_04970 [Caulobacter sp. FWC2]|nr:hypothetical protein CSW62_04970 [Caulobacter sp. FWC2]
MELGDKAVARDTSKRPQGPLQASVRLGTGAAIDIWCDGISTCRGELQFNGARYWLNFSGVLGAEERLSQARREPGDWSFGDRVAEEIVVPMSRRQISYDSPAHRFAASPVFTSKNRETGIFPQMFVALLWEGQAVKSAVLFNGPDIYEATFAVNTATNSKAPDYKGRLVQA